MSTSLLDVDDLAIAFKAGSGYAEATRGISLSLEPGETMALVGESGSGKSVTALALMGLLPRQARVTFRKMRFAGRDLGEYQAADEFEPAHALRGAGF
jgi:ABC-type glutathione transport system ATPase component